MKMEPIMEATRVSFSYEEEPESQLVLDDVSLTSTYSRGPGGVFGGAGTQRQRQIHPGKAF